MQRRWLAGFFYFVTSTLALIWFARVAYVVIKAYYGLAFDPMNAPAEIPGPLGLVLPFAVWLVVYVAGIVDTALVSWRKR